jgi:CHAT domain-containing protein
VEDSNEHLSVDELIAILEGKIPLGLEGPAAEHTRTCPLCGRALAVAQEKLNRLRRLSEWVPAPPGEQCLSASQIAELATGMGPEKDAAIWLAHAATCDSCGTRLREAVKDFDVELTPGDETLIASLPSSQPEWKRGMAQQLIRKASSPKPPRRKWLVAGIAASLLAALLGWRYWSAHRPEAIGDLLAEAYSGSRELEYRLPDRGYANLTRRRGTGNSPVERHTALLKAETWIAEGFPAHSEDSRWLHVKGIAELLEWSPDAAVADLSTARALSPNDPSLLTDLAIAYAMRAETAQHPVDYATALDLLGKALQLDASHLRARFNLALIQERLFNYQDAIEQWQAYLRLDVGSPWANEARRRLNDLLEKVKRRDAMWKQIQSGQQAFLEAVSGPSVRALDVYLERWAVEWLAGSNSAMDSRGAADLAGRLRDRNRDEWLSDALRQRPAGDPSYGELLTVIDANISGEAEPALPLAEALTHKLERSGAHAAAMRARFEHVYALHRAVRAEQCRDGAATLLRMLEGRPYPWLRVQTRLEWAICNAMLGKPGEAITAYREAESEAGRFGLDGIGLRARGLRIGTQTNAGDPWIVWTDGLALAEQYWQAGYSPIRLHQISFNFSRSCEQLDLRQAAYAFAKTGVRAVAATPNRLLEAMGRSALAGLALRAGMPDESVAESGRAQDLFRALPPSESVRRHIEDATLDAAEAEVMAGNAAIGLSRIATLNPAGAARLTFLIDLRKHQVAGLAQLRLTNLQEADRELAEARSYLRRRLQSLQSERERFVALNDAAPVYRGIAQLLISKGRPIEALQSVLDLRGAGSRVRVEPDGTAPWMDASERWLVYVTLPGGFGVWRIDKAGTEFRRLSTAPAQARESAARLLALAAQPTTEIGRVRAQARDLYQMLCGVFGDVADSHDSLMIVPDDELAGVPFGLLCGGDGRFLWERLAITIARRVTADLPRQVSISSHSRALVVSVPVVNPRSGQRLPPLPEAERDADAIAARFADHARLSGAAVTEAAIRAEARRSQLFHFSGHGFSNGGNGGLLTSADSGQPLSSSAIASMDWSQCEVVVLAACLTAAGEQQLFANPHSLARAFALGGARSIIASLWNVDSAATSTLLDTLYDALVQGTPAAAALRSAAVRLKSDSRFAHPYYWGAFQIYQ